MLHDACLNIVRELREVASWADRGRRLTRYLALRREAFLLPFNEANQRQRAFSEAYDEIGLTPEETIELVSLNLDIRKTPIVTVTQHSVGHGGFHTGALGIEVPRLRWIYDCGAWRGAEQTALSKAIKCYAEKAKNADMRDASVKPAIHLFYISHFDADHINGIETLLNSVTVDTVVIPYLEPAVQFALVAEAIAGGQDVEALASAVLDASEWLGPFGVRRIVRIKPSEEDGRALFSANSPALLRWPRSPD